MDEDVYFLAFLNGLIHRQPCYACPYACDKRISDLTIGDFWGLQKGSLNGYKGRISVALVNTEKGNHFLHQVLPKFYAEKRTVKEAISGNDQLNRPSLKHKDRDVFCLSFCNNQRFTEAIECTSIGKNVRKNILINRIKYLPRLVKRWIFQ